LTGTVVNSKQGEPIRRVLVAVPADGVAELTDSRGNFELAGVSAGQATIVFQKPGYFGTHGEPSGEARVKVGVDTPSITLKLAPAAIISGHVLDTDDKPLEGAQVGLYQNRAYGSIRKTVVRVGEQTTDEHGRFRFGSLSADDYFVAVEQSRTFRLIQPGVPNGREGGWATTFYPGVSDSSQAQAIHAMAGEESTVALTVKMEPMYHLSGKVSGVEGGAGITFHRVAGDGNDFLSAAAAENGTFECMLPAGTYFAENIFFRDTPLVATGALEVAGDRSDARVVLTPVASIPVRLRYESNSDVDPGKARESVLQIGLAGSISTRRMPVLWRPDQSELINALPGRYSLEVSTNGPWRVKSARCGDLDLLTEKLTVFEGSQPAPIDLILSDDAATLHANVPSLPEAGESSSGLKNPRAANSEAALTLVLVRTDTPQPALRYFRANTRDTEMNGLAPGDYALLAIADGDVSLLTRASALDTYLSGAQRIHMNPRDTVTVTVAATETEGAQ
jgi:hypothetical protein